MPDFFNFLTFLILAGSFWVIKQLQINPIDTNQKVRFWHILGYDIWIFGEKATAKLKQFLRVK
jgi:hypothetical protein